VPLGSLTLVSVRGVTTVLPVWLMGLGWDTSRADAMLIVNSPCETAQVATGTSPQSCPSVH
jgi:hypothetical protein